MPEIPIEPEPDPFATPPIKIRSSKLTRKLSCRESIFAAYGFNPTENTFDL